MPRLSRVAVTGALGLLGSEVVEQLRAESRHVVAIDRREATPMQNGELLRDDLTSRDRLTKIFEGLEAVVHCAAIPNPSVAPADVVFNNNVMTTANVLMAAAEAGVTRVVYTSSQAVLGLAFAAEILAPDFIPINETHPCRPSEAYGLSKFVGEQLCAMVAAQSRVSVRCLRFPVIWSPARFRENVSARLGNPVQAAKSNWAYIDLRDAALACRLALDDESFSANEVFHIAAPWMFCEEGHAATALSAYGDYTMVDPIWSPGRAVFGAAKAERLLGFRAKWQWTPTAIRTA